MAAAGTDVGVHLRHARAASFKACEAAWTVLALAGSRPWRSTRCSRISRPTATSAAWRTPRRSAAGRAIRIAVRHRRHPVPADAVQFGAGLGAHLWRADCAAPRSHVRRYRAGRRARRGFRMVAPASTVVARRFRSASHRSTTTSMNRTRRARRRRLGAIRGAGTVSWPAAAPRSCCCPRR